MATAENRRMDSQLERTFGSKEGAVLAYLRNGKQTWQATFERGGLPVFRVGSRELNLPAQIRGLTKAFCQTDRGPRSTLYLTDATGNSVSP
jgi:hypothetical protein